MMVYTVNRKVADFPEKEDMSTPEAAYATLNRLLASGDEAFWQRLSAPPLAKEMPKQSGKREISAEAAARFLGAEILEVNLWRQTNAVVLAQMSRDIDLRWLCRVGGQWLNDGNDGVPNLEKARARVAHGRAYRDAEPPRQEAERLRHSRPPVPDPEKHLRPFVEFLKREAADPQAFLFQALAKHRVVILGEVHNGQRYWAFNAALVRSPRFAQLVGVIYLELPCNDQPLMDQFLAAPKYDPAPVIDVLRDTHEFGWPDQPTLEFCQTVWEVNQSLPKAQRLRIVLADMARPWKEIHSRADWAKHYNVDRDEFMGRQIARSWLGEQLEDRRSERRRHPAAAGGVVGPAAVRVAEIGAAQCVALRQRVEAAVVRRQVSRGPEGHDTHSTRSRAVVRCPPSGRLQQTPKLADLPLAGRRIILGREL
ncbi:MAG: hypothetical protein HZA90_17150 [Verrucomicrobia bacterium]|nr:hypothetical protein [Verrucomicrobiota bacterium]